LRPLGQTAGQGLLHQAPETLARFKVLAVALAEPQPALGSDNLCRFFG
jgi:hypothetical protein